MTSGEKAVVQAAIKWTYSRPYNWTRIVGSDEDILAHDVMALVYNCVECNTDTHRCGGCGENVGHGDNDCGKNCTNDPVTGIERDGSTYPCWECLTDPTEDPAPWCDCRPEDFGAAHPGHACRLRAHDVEFCLNRPQDAQVKVLVWYPRTWVDVRAGDQVRLPDSDVTATIATAVHLHWHVDPRSSEYEPRPLEWSGVQVRFEGEDQPLRTMDPAKPIDILLSPQEHSHIKFLGWPNRIGMIKKEVSR